MLKKNLKNNPEKIFITEDLTKTRQFIVKELNTQKREQGAIKVDILIFR
jgi:hypothetical protein